MPNYSYAPMRDLQGYLKPSEIDKLINNASNERDKLLILLLSRTGRRIGEMLNIKPGDINEEECAIIFTLEKKKNLERVMVPIDHELLARLMTYIDKNSKEIEQNGYIFYSYQKKKYPITRQRAFQIIRGVGDAADLTHIGDKKLHPHHLRHSFAVEASKQLQNPADLRKLQKLLGHSSIAITEFYLQFGDKETKDLIKKMWK